MRLLRVAAPALALTIALGLAGCVPDAEPSKSPSPSPSRTAGDDPSTTPSATPSGSAAARPASQRISAACDELVSNQTVYDFNPIYSPKSPAAPASGSEVSAIAASGGRDCQWLNTSDGTTIDLGVARYDAATTSALASAYSGGTAVAAWGSPAWFAVSGGIGTGVVAQDGLWVVVSSPAFATTADAAPFITSAVAAAG